MYTDVSHAELRRQIAREGRRLGLVPMLKDGRICIGQKKTVLRQHGDQPGYSDTEVSYVCDVTMAHGFAGALRNLRRLEKRDLNQLYDERQARVAKANEKRWADKSHDFDAFAQRMIRRMGWDAFMEALAGPDPRRGRR